MKLNALFGHVADKVSKATGHPFTFVLCCAVIIVWAVSGPIFHFSDTWQLIINTGTTIITFLMVFLIQNTQNRDAKAIHLKLDELIRSIKGARNSMVNLEELSDQDLKDLKDQFQRLRERTGDRDSALETLRDSVDDAISEKAPQ